MYFKYIGTYTIHRVLRETVSMAPSAFSGRRPGKTVQKCKVGNYEISYTFVIDE